MYLEKNVATGLKKARSIVIIITAFVALSVLPPVFARTANYQKLLEDAIAVDLANLDAGELATLQGLFGLTNGTRQAFIGGKLSRQDNVDFGDARDNAVALISADPPDFQVELENFLYGSVTTKGGRAYLADAVPSIEMNSPGILPNVAHQLFLQRGEFAYTSADGLTVENLQQLDLAAANAPVTGFATLAMNDKTRPAVLPAPIGAWNNDGYLVYDEDGEDIHIFFQHNPFAYNWNHMHWGHLVIEDNGEVENLPIALEPRPEEGYNHNFSGSISPVQIPHPNKPEKMVTPAFWTAVGTGENGFASFLEVPPTVMAVTEDSDLKEWEAERFTIHDKDVLFFGAQRRGNEGNLAGFNHTQGVEYYVGEFDPHSGMFTPDTHAGANGFFEYGRSFYAINATC